MKMAAHASGCYGYLHTRYSVALTLTSLWSPPGGGWGRSGATVTTVTTMTTTMMRLMVVAMVVMHGKASRSGTDRAGGRCFTATLGGNKAKNNKVTQQKDKKSSASSNLWPDSKSGDDNRLYGAKHVCVCVWE